MNSDAKPPLEDFPQPPAGLFDLNNKLQIASDVVVETNAATGEEYRPTFFITALSLAANNNLPDLLLCIALTVEYRRATDAYWEKHR